MDKNQEKQAIHDAVAKITRYMDLNCNIEIREESNTEGNSLFVTIYTPENARFLIGKGGQNLRALEQIIKLIICRGGIKPELTFTLDVNDYKKSRAQKVIELARTAVGRVRNTQKAEALLPMTAYERRVVHMELAAYPDITTESIGEEPQRRIVIKPFP